MKAKPEHITVNILPAEDNSATLVDLLKQLLSRELFSQEILSPQAPIADIAPQSPKQEV